MGSSRCRVGVESVSSRCRVGVEWGRVGVEWGRVSVEWGRVSVEWGHLDIVSSSYILLVLIEVIKPHCIIRIHHIDTFFLLLIPMK